MSVLQALTFFFDAVAIVFSISANRMSRQAMERVTRMREDRPSGL